MSGAISARPVAVSTAIAQVAAISSAPTQLYRQHHDVVAPQVDTTAFRQGWRVTTRLDGLLEAGRIDREQWDAAYTWRRWAETIAPSQVQRWDIRVDRPTVPNDLGMLSRVHAAAQLRAAADALGPLRIKLLESVLVKDLTWSALGQLLRVSDKTAKDRAVEAIAALTAWCAGEPVPPEPALRFRNQPGSW